MEAATSWLMWVVVVGCIVATITDLSTRKIPNPVVVAILLAAIAFHGAQGVVPLLCSIGAMAIVLIPGTYAHTRGWLGGGDVKLAAVVAAAFSFPDAIAFVLFTALAGGVLAIAWVAAARGRHLVQEVPAYVGVIGCGVVPHINTSGTRKLPYALAIASGALVVYASHGAMPFLKLWPLS